MHRVATWFSGSLEQPRNFSLKCRRQLVSLASRYLSHPDVDLYQNPNNRQWRFRPAFRTQTLDNGDLDLYQDPDTRQWRFRLV
ncbi:hypothetical protein RRG08_049278 [Elysia crispata]|uniref:Uncharacterized protein n=1 Tax=Elysia crispata TaxID=231223 RepID=A0AAE0ZP96_9GAST|nr:hypothetical protein RRG08_049278 [Elysia crispata]